MTGISATPCPSMPATGLSVLPTIKVRRKRSSSPLMIQHIPGECGTLILVDLCKKMKLYSIEFREKIVKAYEQCDTSIRKVAARFDVSKAFVQKILKQKQATGHVQPKKPGGSVKSVLHSHTTLLTE